jgi:alpha-amylase
MPGNPFIYYGEEIGMTGTGVDQNKRLPMVWSSDGKDSPRPPAGATQTAQTDGGSVAQQEKNPDSLLNWYKKVLRVKAKYPAISSSHVTAVDTKHSNLSVLNCGQDLTIITNYSPKETTTLDLPNSASTKIADTLSIHDATASFQDGKLSIPPYTTVILAK